MTCNANDRLAFVIIDSDLEANDGDQFRSKTSFLSKTVIAFRGGGGKASPCRRGKLALRFGLRDWALSILFNCQPCGALGCSPRRQKIWKSSRVNCWAATVSYLTITPAALPLRPSTPMRGRAK